MHRPAMRPLRRRLAPAAALGAAAALALGQGPRATVEAQAGVAIQVNAAADRRPIDPRIYGVNWATPAQLLALNAPVHRWGGNSVTRYNWQQNADNRGSDWYFESIPGASATAGASADAFVSDSRQGGAEPMMTVPLIGWVAKVGPGRSKLASFSAAKYGAQADCDWSWFPDACNGVRPNGSLVTGNDPNDANLPSTPALQKQWVEHLVSRWGGAANGGLRYYLYDNEPTLWHSTHRDVHPTGVRMTELRDAIVSYGTAIRQADPAAVLVGPEEWGWMGYFWSGYDQQHMSATGCWTCWPDRDANGGAEFMPWLLAQMRQHEQATGVRLLDVFSLHYYPQGGEFSDDVSTAMQQRRNRSTRSLWDPNYVDETWINDRVRLIPRMREWVDAQYPGRALAVTEYSWGAEGHINGATAQADVLGIFGREGLHIGTRWVVPATSTPTFKAFQMYRNYDGNRSTFGGTSVRATVPNPDTVAAFAAERAPDGALTVIVINKTTTGTAATIGLSGFAPGAAAQAWQLTASNAIQRLADVPVAASSLSTTLPAQSITLFVVPKGTVTPPPPPPPASVPGDFNGDGQGDLLWHHQGTGELYAWLMTGTRATAGSYLTPRSFADVSWQIRGLADFNGDGRTDILWHHQKTGDLYVWFLNGTVTTSGSYLTPKTFADTSWQIRATADFNKDGKPDILWHHQKTGDLYAWFLNGVVTASGSYLDPSRFADTRWQIRAVLDPNQDGSPDLLWHHQGTGDLYVWLMNGTRVVSGSHLTPSRFTDTRWQLVRACDFTGDGTSDLLWHHQATGQLYAWFLTGTTATGGSFLDPPAFTDTRWKVMPR